MKQDAAKCRCKAWLDMPLQEAQQNFQSAATRELAQPRYATKGSMNRCAAAKQRACVDVSS